MKSSPGAFVLTGKGITKSFVNASSSDLTTATCCWVERYCPGTLQERRPDACSPSHTAFTQDRSERLEGGRSYLLPAFPIDHL